MSIGNNERKPSGKYDESVRGIPDALRRGARLNKTQLRWSLVVFFALLFILAAVMVFTLEKSNDILLTNERADAISEAIGAERVEIEAGSTKLHLTQEHGVKKTGDGERILLLQKPGVVQNSYWLTVCADEAAAEYEAALGKNKNMIQLGARDGKGLWIFVAKEKEVEKSKASLPGAVFVPLNRLYSDDVPEGMTEEDFRLMTQMAEELHFIQFGTFGTVNDSSVRLIRGTEAEIAEAEQQKTNLRLFRLILIALLIAALGALAFTLKSGKVLRKPANTQRVIRLSILAVCAVMLIGLVVLTVRINQQGDLLTQYDEVVLSADPEPADADPAAETDRSGKFNYVIGNGKKAKTVSVSVPATVAGFGLCRTVFYVSLVLLVLLIAAMLYFYRYERDLGFSIFNAAVLIILMFITLYPVLNTVAYSFNDGTDAARGGIGIVPRKFSVKSYDTVLWHESKAADGTTVRRLNQDIMQAGLISASKTILTTILNLFWTGMLSFALSRREFVLRRFITLVMVLTMYVNAGLIPSYLLISQTLNLRNSFWVYIIPTMFSCFNMIIIRTYIASLPNELVESARIDGAGDFRIYWQIIFPLCAPVLATVALFVAVGAWNSWFDTMLYNDNNQALYTLQYYLKGKLANAGQTSNLANATVDAAAASAAFSVTPRTIQCAITVITALPILIIYPFLQKYFVTGMALGSVKG